MRKVVDIKKVNDTDYVIVVDYIPNKISKLLGFKTKQYIYQGSGTVWYDLERRVRCDTGLEVWLTTKVALYKMNKNVK